MALTSSSMLLTSPRSAVASEPASALDVVELLELVLRAPPERLLPLRLVPLRLPPDFPRRAVDLLPLRLVDFAGVSAVSVLASSLKSSSMSLPAVVQPEVGTILARSRREAVITLARVQQDDVHEDAEHDDRGAQQPR